MVELSKRKEGNPLRWEIVEDMERGREREAGGEVEEEAERERERLLCCNFIVLPNISSSRVS